LDARRCNDYCRSISLMPLTGVAAGGGGWRRRGRAEKLSQLPLHNSSFPSQQRAAGCGVRALSSHCAAIVLRAFVCACV